jgi:RNA binding exosome subunit
VILGQIINNIKAFLMIFNTETSSKIDRTMNSTLGFMTACQPLNCFGFYLDALLIVFF